MRKRTGWFCSLASIQRASRALRGTGHSAATLLLTAGEDLGVISRILGQSDLGTTIRVDARLDPKRAKAAAGRIDAALHRRLVNVEGAIG